jgi:hypothetical protein
MIASVAGYITKLKLNKKQHPMPRIITFQMEATVEQKWVLCYYVLGSSKVIPKNHDQIQVTVEQTAYIGMQILP